MRIYEINTWPWLNELSIAAGQKLTLAHVPARAWDDLATVGASTVWLMGVWQRSSAGVAIARRNSVLLAELRQHLPDFHPKDLIGSAYCIQRYTVDPRLGGEAGLRAARSALAQRGMQLMLDFVPNHLAPDHPWVAEHPDWFIQGTPQDLRQHRDAFLRAQGRIFARGRDPYFPPWSDVLQLNAFNVDYRKAAIDQLRIIADQCDSVRCDMAMLVMNDVFVRTWGDRAGAPPTADYWQEIIPAVKATHPHFRFIAEAYWDRERALLQQGFDACYDKGLYDQLAHGSAASVRQHLIRFTDVHDRLVRFIENHDEPRAAGVFARNQVLAAATVLLTLPGIALLHDGQVEGRKLRVPVHLARRAPETPDDTLAAGYRKLLKITANPVFQRGSWRLCPTMVSGAASAESPLLAWVRQHEDHSQLVVINYSAEPVAGAVMLPGSLADTPCRWARPDGTIGCPADVSSPDGGNVPVRLGPWGTVILRAEHAAA